MDAKNPLFLRCLEALKDSIFFGKLPTDELRTLLTAMAIEKWNAKTFKSGQEVTSKFHFIVSGRIKIYQINPNTGREYTIVILTKGNVFDVLFLMDDEVHNVYWEALEDIELLVMRTKEMRENVAKNPNLELAVINYLTVRMRVLEEVATDISLHSTLTRLANLLLKNINGHSHQLQLINDLPNEEIASLIGTTRAVVNRHIQELKSCGAISVKRKHIDVENLQLLISIAEEKY